MQNDLEKFDLCVIGAGIGGLRVAENAAKLGLKVALIEKAKMGGDHLNTGCVPSKALLHVAKIAHTFRKSDVFGIKSVEPEIDFSAVKDYVFDTIAAIEPRDSKERFEAMGIDVVQKSARFLDSKTIQADDRKIYARYFVIATGSRALVPPINGLQREKVYTNENIFALKEKPKHLIILGGGPIGIEMSQAHARLGCRVSVITNGTIAQKDDPELVRILRPKLIEEGIELYEDVNIKNVKHLNGVICVTMEHGGEEFAIEGSHILTAMGRVANVNGLDLEKAGVEYTINGIKIDGRLRTSRRNIFAIGDVVGEPQFTHVACHHADVVTRNICFKESIKVDYKALPWVTYCDPELANVGLTHQMARDKHGADNIKILTCKFDKNDRAQTQRNVDGMIKVILNKKGKILGASIIGSNAGELIGLWALAITNDMNIDDLKPMITPYPTLGGISKSVADEWFAKELFTDSTKFVVKLLQRFL